MLFNELLTNSSNQSCLCAKCNVQSWSVVLSSFLSCFIADSGVGSTVISDGLSNQHSIPYQSLPEISTVQSAYSMPMQPVSQLQQGTYQQQTAQPVPGAQQQQAIQLPQGVQQQQTTQLHQGAQQQQTTQLHQGAQQGPTMQLHPRAQPQQTAQLFQGAKAGRPLLSFRDSFLIF